ncbi:class A beta-lactamase-related serine hydrolase [Prolixibacteraceae bacterium JC049]|nr:class A beta-lactamase-related serine hydrolase [Prolixibacteraceae bacterium JC049]
MSVIKKGKLVFSKGYGWANVEEAEPMSPAHILRVASVSKLITAVGIMKLVDDGLLNLDDKVFGKEGIINDSIYGKMRDRRLKKVTVKNLLNHSAGWSQRYGDPAFYPSRVARRVDDNLPASIDTYLKYIMKQRLHYYPGTRSLYSNMGYMVLAKVIENISGENYEDYIRFHVLYPAGIYDMYIGHSKHAEARKNECKYYEQRGERKVISALGEGIYVDKSDGGNHIELLGAAGGWICSSAELVKLISVIDGDPANPDIITAERVKEMTTVRNGLFPLGWKAAVSNGTWWRTGSMAGTSTMVKRLPDGTIWAILINTSSWRGSKFPREINKLMSKIMGRVKEWPDQNLFEHLQPKNFIALN